MNRGSQGASRRRQRRPSRFNEAPIHESGKYPKVKLTLGRLAASMRPRFMNRGSRRDGQSEALRARRFNEAPIHESGKYCLRLPAGRQSQSWLQ